MMGERRVKVTNYRICDSGVLGYFKLINRNAQKKKEDKTVPTEQPLNRRIDNTHLSFIKAWIVVCIFAPLFDVLVYALPCSL